MSKNKERDTETMEKMGELTISDVKELTQGKKSQGANGIYNVNTNNRSYCDC